MRVSEPLLPLVFLLTASLVVTWLMLVLTTEAEVEAVENGADAVNLKEDAGFGTIKVDETTGCEYFIFRNIMTPRIDETGTKVRGCKESE